MARKAGRPKSIPNSAVISIRFDEELYRLVQDVASLECVVTGRKVTAHELIRNAVQYVYGDNERMREVFRRIRSSSSNRNRQYLEG